MGNHEAEFLADPRGSKFDEFAGEIRAAHLDPIDVAACHARSASSCAAYRWPPRVNDWFFCHAGNTTGRGLSQMRIDLESGVDHDGFGLSN